MPEKLGQPNFKPLNREYRAAAEFSLEQMFLAGVMTCVATALASNQYQVGIEDLSGQQVILGTLNLAPSPAYPVADFATNSGGFPAPHSGCIGIFGDHGFVCQNEFKNLPSAYEAIRAYIGPDGKVVQVQLAEGSPGQLFIEVPSFIPRPEMQPAKAVAKVAADNKETLHNKWQEAKGAPADVTDEINESEKSLLEKYWIYLVPIVLLMIPSLFSPANR